MIDELSKVCKTLEKESIKNTLKLDSKCFAMIKPESVEELSK